MYALSYHCPFALAAILGIVILKNWLTVANTARAVVYAHGIVAAIALVLLLVHTLRHPVLKQA